jgi:hypothetical protein
VWVTLMDVLGIFSADVGAYVFWALDGGKWGIRCDFTEHVIALQRLSTTSTAHLFSNLS